MASPAWEIGPDNSPDVPEVTDADVFFVVSFGSGAAGLGGSWCLLLSSLFSASGPRPKRAEWDVAFAAGVFLGGDEDGGGGGLLVGLARFLASWEARADFMSEELEGSGLLILLAGVELEGGDVVFVVSSFAPLIWICSGSLPGSKGESAVPFPGGPPEGGSTPG